MMTSLSLKHGNVMQHGILVGVLVGGWHRTLWDQDAMRG